MCAGRMAAAGLLCASAACAPAVRSGPAPAPLPITVALVDSVPFATEMHDGFLRRVEVRSASRIDTIPDVLTHARPTVTPDGRVLGFAWDGMDLRDAFVYAPAARRLERIALPNDADRAFTTPAFSPDGRYLAYVSYPAEGGSARGLVRRDVRGPVVVRTDSVAVPGMDSAFNFARWLDAETFEIYIDVGEEGMHRWLGTVSGGVTRGDTVPHPQVPRWEP